MLQDIIASCFKQLLCTVALTLLVPGQMRARKEQAVSGRCAIIVVLEALKAMMGAQAACRVPGTLVVRARFLDQHR
jgi:hypothetical protein